MPAQYSQFATVLIAALIVYAVYRRFRRTFGRQRLQPARMIFRIGLLAIIGCLLSPSVLRGGAFAAAIGMGLALGVGLALFGASRTRFEREDNQVYYLPHTYIGVLVSLLFLTRLGYRLIQGFGLVQTAHPAGDPAFASMLRSPLTLGMFYVLVGYYVCYYVAVLLKSKHTGVVLGLTTPAANQ